MMKRYNVCVAALAAVFAAAVSVSGQGLGDVEFGGASPPSFDVQFSAGFNYDLLRSPTDVSFKYPVGYVGFNLPIGSGGNLMTVPALQGLIDDIYEIEVEGDRIFSDSGSFKPNAGARQNGNYTVRVDVPMIGGVGSFAYTQNFFMNFSTAVGGTSVLPIRPIKIAETMSETSGETVTETNVDGFMSVSGAIRVPFALNLGWETMTFGYAYRVADNDDLVFALNLHRHLFNLDVRAKADIDLLGHLKLNADATIRNKDVSQNISIINYDDILLDYDSDMCNGSAVGRYRAAVWTPTIGAKLWRFTYAGRFGINTKVDGYITGRFVVPAIVDLEKGDMSQDVKDLESDLKDDVKKVLDRISETGDPKDLLTQELDSVVYHTSEPMTWKMPDGHTFGFEIVRNRLSVSYTKIFGDVEMQIRNLNKSAKVVEDESAEEGGDGGDNDGNWELAESVNINVGASVDHVIMLHVNFPSVFFNIGVCAFDVRSGDSDKILRTVYGDNDLDYMYFGKGVMLPILNGGLTLGTKLQLRVEGALLPLPAVRTGVHYYF